MRNPITNKLRSIILLRSSVSDAADALGVGRPALSRVLNGKAQLSIALAYKIERVYKYSGLALLEEQLRWNYRKKR